MYEKSYTRVTAMIAHETCNVRVSRGSVGRSKGGKLNEAIVSCPIDVAPSPGH